jgi:hypothetical protein
MDGEGGARRNVRKGGGQRIKEVMRYQSVKCPLRDGRAVHGMLGGGGISNTVIPIKLNQHLVPNTMKHSVAGV